MMYGIEFPTLTVALIFPSKHSILLSAIAKKYKYLKAILKVLAERLDWGENYQQNAFCIRT